MEQEGVRAQVEAIDAWIREYPWMDFEVWEYVGYELVIAGSIDPSVVPPNLEIRFRDVFFMSLPMAWRTDTSRTVFSLLQGEEARAVNLKFGVEQGHWLFRFRPEDPEGLECLVAAREVSIRRTGTAPPPRAGDGS